MEDPALSKNFVDAAALRRYNFFKGLILVLLAALLLSLWGFTRQFASIQAPTLNGPAEAIVPGSVLLNGRGTPNSDIDVQMDGQSIGMATVDADGNWSLNTDLAAGEYAFIARALDPDGGERGRSSSLTLNVAEPIAYTAPTLTLPSGEVKIDAVPFSGTGTPGSTVELFTNGISVGTVVVGDDGQWQINAPIARYLNEVEVIGLTPDGMDIGSSGIQRLALAAAAAGLTLDAPHLGEFGLDANGRSQALITLSGTGEPHSQVRLAVGGVDLGMVAVNTDGNWSFAGDLAMEPGTYDLQANMVGPDGANLSVAEFAGLVIPDIAAASDAGTPTLAAEPNADGDMVLYGTAVPGSTVEIVVDGEVVGTAVADDAGSWSWLPDLALGAYEFSARSTAAPDLVSEAQLVRIGRPVNFGDVAIVDMGNGRNELVLQGTAVPNSQIQILIDGEVVDTVTADANGSWTYTTTLPNGSYAVNGRYLDMSETQAEQMAAAQTITVGQPSGALQIAFTVTAASADGGAGTASANAPAVEIILDASGSMLDFMNGTTRFEVARAALQNINENVLPAGTPIAVRAFGNIEGNYSCRTDLMIPYQPLDKDAMGAFLAQVNPQVDANTPLADSLSRVKFDLAEASDRQQIVVLLTDGKETCGGDPATQIQALRDSGVDVQVNIVGLAIADDALKAEFERWAEIGGGQYFDANVAERLAEVLGEALLTSYIVRDETGEVVAIGRVGGLAQTLPVGTYTVEVNTAPAILFEMVEIVAGETVQLTLDK